MKSLSKVLSLALVIALSLSLIVVAGAAVEKLDDYKDRDDIADEYVEAVDVLTAIHVLKGYEDDTLKPTSNVTRAEAAKLVAYISIGTTAADRLAHRPSSFTDVATDHWANPFIEFGVERGLINGVGGGKFDPEGSVTGSQVGKLMLTALGYGTKGEYVGNSWELNAVVDGQKRGILTVDTDYSAPAKREEVIQYVFNTISPINPTGNNYLVKFSTIINDYVWANSTSTLQAIGVTGSAQFLGQETFGLLARTGNDNYGYAGHNWALNVNPNKHITGFYKTDAVLGENKAGVPVPSLTDRYNPTYIAPLPVNNQVAYYINGIRVDRWRDAAGVWQTIETPRLNQNGTLAEAVAGGENYFLAGGTLYQVTDAAGVALSSALSGPGAVTNIRPVIRPGVIVTLVDSGFDRRSDFPGTVITDYLGNVVNIQDREFYAYDGTVDAVIIIEKTVHDVAGVPIVAANGDVRIPGVVTDPLHADQIDYPKDLVAKDVVLRHTDAFNVTHVEKTKTVTGKMTYINRTRATATVEGGDYADSGLVGANAPLFDTLYGYARNTTNLDKLTLLHLDDGGFAVRALLAEPTVPPTYGFVVGYQPPTGLRGEARVVLQDNTNALRLLTVATNAKGYPDISGYGEPITPAGAGQPWDAYFGEFAAADTAGRDRLPVPVEYKMKDDKVILTPLPSSTVTNPLNSPQLTLPYTGRSVTINLPVLPFNATGDAVISAQGPYYITSDTAILYSDGSRDFTRVLKSYTATRDAAATTVVSGVVIPGTRNLAAVYFRIAAPVVAPTRYFFLADATVDVADPGATEHPTYEYRAFVNGQLEKIKTRDRDLLLRSTTIDNAIPGLWAYDGNNDDLTVAIQQPRANSYGLVDWINETAASGITYIGLNDAQAGIVCTPTTKYYAVYYADQHPFLPDEARVQEYPINVSNDGIVYIVEGVEFNNDGTARTVYFTYETVSGGVNGYIAKQIAYAEAANDRYNRISGDESAAAVPPATPVGGIASITAEIVAARTVMNNNTGTYTRPQKLMAANKLRGAVASYVIGLNAAQQSVDVNTDAANAIDSITTGPVSRATVESALDTYFGLPYLWTHTTTPPGPDPVYTWPSDAAGLAAVEIYDVSLLNYVVTIKFADGVVIPWILDNAHTS